MMADGRKSNAAHRPVGFLQAPLISLLSEQP